MLIINKNHTLLVNSIKILDDFVNTRLDRFLKKTFSGVTQATIEICLRKGLIKVNNKKIKSNYRLQYNDLVEVKITPVGQVQEKKTISRYNQEIITKINKAIIFQDKNILVLNKFSGIAVQGGSKILHSLDNYLVHMFPDSSPKLVHRLDKETSGILLFALNNKAAAELSTIIKDRKIAKKYWCIVTGEVVKQSGLIKDQLSNSFKVEQTDEDGREAITKFKVLQKNKLASFLEMMPLTGRKHQLRVHCLGLGHPILGDGKYGGKKAFIPNISSKIHLHAREILIPDFFGQKLNFIAPLPEHMLETIKFLDFNIAV